MENVLKNHRELLKARGYDEVSLNNNDPADRLFIRLQIKLSKCICKGISDKKATSFFLSTTGFFNNKTDIILFRLHYQYDPVKQQLYLKSLSAKMEDCQKLFFLLNSSSLPYSSDVYCALFHSRRMKAAKDLINNTYSVHKGKSYKL